jgi:putative ABC transport system ATP-binding protein
VSDGQGMIEVENLEKTYQRGDGTPVMALKDISFTIADGEFVTVRGASGSGKSSLLNILGCLDTPTSGSYRLAGEDVSSYTDEQRSRLRCSRIGFIFQTFNLLPRTTALENIEVPALYSGERVDEAKAAALLERVGLAERGKHYVTELSGGEQQRVAIARALMNDPPLLLADEPTGNLDSAAGESIMQLLADLHAEGRTIILVTHDEATAAYAQRELQIRDGIIASDRSRSVSQSVAGASD